MFATLLATIPSFFSALRAGILNAAQVNSRPSLYQITLAPLSSHGQLTSRQWNATLGRRTATAALYARAGARSASVQSEQITPPICVKRGGRSWRPVQKLSRGNDSPKPSPFTTASLRVQVT